LINVGKTVKLRAKQLSLYGDNAMEFLQLAEKRQSTRTYLEKPVEREKIERCLEAARLAPSACNCQPWKFVVVDDPELKTIIAKQTFGKLISFNRFTLQAPVLVLVIAQRQNAFARFAGFIKKRPLKYFDIGIAAEHFCLQAAEEGLGTCMLGWFKSKVIKKQLHIPRNKRVELLITLGYPPSDEIREKKRKNIDQIRTYNCYDAAGETENL
jgi:nitroreductase